VRSALQALSGTSACAEAEVLFLDLVSCAVPPHHATDETSTALELRKRAIAARRQALLAEAGLMEARRERVAAFAATVAAARERASGLATRAASLRPAAPVATPASNPEASGQPAAQVSADAATPLSPDGPPPGAAGTQPGQPTNARVHQRVRIERMVTLTSHAGTLVGFCRNLSVGGLFLTTYDKFLPTGTPVELTLTLTGPLLRIAGSVRHVKRTGDGMGMGIDFGDANPEIALALYTFLNQQGTDFWEPDE
jgi:hypothetical protein